MVQELYANWRPQFRVPVVWGVDLSVASEDLNAFLGFPDWIGWTTNCKRSLEYTDLRRVLYDGNTKARWIKSANQDHYSMPYKYFSKEAHM